ncbi:DUF6300 family protein [Streptomyces sp. NPDC059349]|uniref:DUF6300 family protein n=1 Tax=Streptomyces sp. NPDC059349 TaxID=3346808 RepID=UPI0036A0636A
MRTPGPFSCLPDYLNRPAETASLTCCGSDLLLHCHGPLMTGVWMELCPACDAHRPAARAFIQWHRDSDRDPKALPQYVSFLGEGPQPVLRHQVVLLGCVRSHPAPYSPVPADSDDICPAAAWRQG